MYCSVWRGDEVPEKEERVGFSRGEKRRRMNGKGEGGEAGSNCRQEKGRVRR